MLSVLLWRAASADAVTRRHAVVHASGFFSKALPIANLEPYPG